MISNETYETISYLSIPISAQTLQQLQKQLHLVSKITTYLIILIDKIITNTLNIGCQYSNIKILYIECTENHREGQERKTDRERASLFALICTFSCVSCSVSNQYVLY